MGYLKEKALGLTAPLELLKGSPWRQEDVGVLDAEDRLRMGAILANRELSFFERRVAYAFRSPKDLAPWLLAGTEEWGVDPKFAPMRALSRAESMVGFLNEEPRNSGAYKAWREGAGSGESRDRSQVGRLSPSSAFTLMFKRRALPEVAAVSMAMKASGRLTLLGSGSGMVGTAAFLMAGGTGAVVMETVGMAVGLLGVTATLWQGIEDAFGTDHSKEGYRLPELWAIRKAACSEGRMKRLAQRAASQALALGYGARDGAQLEDGLVMGSTGKELLKDINKLESQRSKLLKGGLLSALDRGEKAEEMSAEIQRLKSAAAPSLGKLREHLRAFAVQARAEAERSLNPQSMREQSAARRKAKGGELGGAGGLMGLFARQETKALPPPESLSVSSALKEFRERESSVNGGQASSLAATDEGAGERLNLVKAKTGFEALGASEARRQQWSELMEQAIELSPGSALKATEADAKDLKRLWERNAPLLLGAVASIPAKDRSAPGDDGELSAWESLDETMRTAKETMAGMRVRALKAARLRVEAERSVIEANARLTGERAELEGDGLTAARSPKASL